MQIVVVSRNVLAAERTMMIFWDCGMRVQSLVSPAHLFTFMMSMMPVTTPGMLMLMVVTMAVWVRCTAPLSFVILILFVRMLAVARVRGRYCIKGISKPRYLKSQRSNFNITIMASMNDTKP